jgi:hypothetical protein
VTSEILGTDFKHQSDDGHSKHVHCQSINYEHFLHFNNQELLHKSKLYMCKTPYQLLIKINYNIEEIPFVIFNLVNISSFIIYLKFLPRMTDS